MNFLQSNLGNLVGEYWCVIRDGNLDALGLYRRHYSRKDYRDGRKPKLFAWPGEKIILLSFDLKALLVWRKFRSMEKQEGVNCAVFRNEGPHLSSLILQEGMEIAFRRWPGERLYTYVNPQKIRSVNPGCCFKKCGWRQSCLTKGGLIVFEYLEEYKVIGDSSNEHEQKKREVDTVEVRLHRQQKSEPAFVCS